MNPETLAKLLERVRESRYVHFMWEVQYASPYSVTVVTHHHNPILQVYLLAYILCPEGKTYNVYPLSSQRFRLAWMDPKKPGTHLPVTREEIIRGMHMVHKEEATKARTNSADNRASSRITHMVVFKGIYQRNKFVSVHTKEQNLEAAEQLASGGRDTTVGISGLPQDAALHAFFKKTLSQAGLSYEDHVRHIAVDVASDQYGEMYYKVTDARGGQGIIPLLLTIPPKYDIDTCRTIGYHPWSNILDRGVFVVGRILGAQMAAPPPLQQFLTSNRHSASPQTSFYASPEYARILITIANQAIFPTWT